MIVKELDAGDMTRHPAIIPLDRVFTSVRLNRIWPDLALLAFPLSSHMCMAGTSGNFRIFGAVDGATDDLPVYDLWIILIVLQHV